MQSHHLPLPHLIWSVTCSDSIRVRKPSSSWQRPKEGKENFWLGWMWGLSQLLIICLALTERHRYSHANSSHPDAVSETSNLHTYTLLKTLVTDLPGRKTSPREAWASVQHPVYSSSRDSNTKNSSSKNRTVCQERQKSPQAKRFQVRPISHRDFGLCSPPLSPVQSQQHT